MILSSVPDDLSPEERQELESIRRRKEELLHDIQVTTQAHGFFSHTFIPLNQFVAEFFWRSACFCPCWNPVVVWTVALKTQMEALHLTCLPQTLT